MSINAVVRWQDGSHDSTRICEICKLVDCKYPVYKDFYREVKISQKDIPDEPPSMMI